MAKAYEIQRRFFEHFLTSEQNGWETMPRVHLAVRRSREVYDVHTTTDWPLPARYVPLYLDAEPPGHEGQVQYDSRGGSPDRTRIVYRFERETELAGSMMLTLWVSTSEGDDLDLFVLLRKLDAAGREVYFYGENGFARDSVARCGCACPSSVLVLLFQPDRRGRRSDISSLSRRFRFP
ncbi:MAG TPA: CocE/NonD family hydrolase C-terminal non-catalytic domain-containing protein [Ktedonobacteraceae bacterium]